MAKQLTLPTNRRQLFVQAYKTAFSTLIKLSLLISLFAIPLIVLIMVKNIDLSYLLAEAENIQDFNRIYFTHDIVWNATYIPALVILSIGFCGAHYVMKAYAFGDGYTLWKTFWKGIKSDFKRCLIISVLFAVIYFLISFAHCYITILSQDWFTATYILKWVLVLFVACAYAFCVSQLPIYQGSAFRMFSNSFLLTFSSLPKSVLSITLSYLPLFIAYVVSNNILTIVIAALYISIGFANASLVTTLFCHETLDKLVNENRYPEIYRKGLYDENAEQIED